MENTVSHPDARLMVALSAQDVDDVKAALMIGMSHARERENTYDGRYRQEWRETRKRMNDLLSYFEGRAPSVG